MHGTENVEQKQSTVGKGMRAWLKLALGLALIWAMAFVLLPWGQSLPLIRPIMTIITEANIDAGSYWYTQSEETARSQMYVRHAIRSSNNNK
jgi:hypothetical protein